MIGIRAVLGWVLAAMAVIPASVFAGRTVVDFNNDWRFHSGEVEDGSAPETDDSTWLYVNVPHSTILYTPEFYYQKDLGVFWYRRTFTAGQELAGKQLTLTFEGAMQEAQVWLNGEPLGTHQGGYTEFAFDVTGKVKLDGSKNVLAVRLDTRPNSAFAPGRSNPDFQYFGGLYRDVRLTATEPVFITDPILSETVAGGGILLRAKAVSQDSATILAQTEVENRSGESVTVTVRTEIVGEENEASVTVTSEGQTVATGAKATLRQELTVLNPRLWSPNTPELYTVRTTVLSNGTEVDSAETVYGIRKVEWKRDGGCWINGVKTELVGVNLHSETYMRGNAVDNDAIDAEIRRLRNHGFNFIRMSHYPHDRAFYEACDRYGVAVIDCLAGWQFFGNTEAFRSNCQKQMREQIRVNRNHPCVVAWEPSLNESGFDETWARTMHDLVHAELPTEGEDRPYTAGWKFWDVYDLGLGTPQANVAGDAETYAQKPIIVSEYGDWNFGGFNSTTRVKRESGDAAMLTQCDNIQAGFSHNSSKAWYGATAYWDYADYAGFDTAKLTYCGVVDVARLPKFGAYFFRSQTDPDVDLSKYGLESGPMVFIANSWAKGSPQKVRVYTNCDTVELWLDDKLIECRDTPDAKMWDARANTGSPSAQPGEKDGALVSTKHLKHPPFTFDMSQYTPGTGTLKAIAYRDGSPAATFVRRAPKAATKLRLTPEDTRPLRLDGSSAKLVWVEALDGADTVDVSSGAQVTFSVESGPGLVIGEKTVPLRGGQWAVWVRSRRDAASTPIVLKAETAGLPAVTLTLQTQTVTGLPVVPEGGDADETLYEPPAPPVNIVLNKQPVSASSVNNSGTDDAELASYANDGNTATKWCASIPKKTDPFGTHWWQADLGERYRVGQVTIFFDAPAKWQYAVAVSDNADFADVKPSAIMQTMESAASEVDVDLEGATGRYLRVWPFDPAVKLWPCLWEVSANGVSANLAKGKPASASSGTGASLAVDGNSGTHWSAGEVGPKSFTVDLGDRYALERIAVSFLWADASKNGTPVIPVRHDFSLEGSLDGTDGSWFMLGAWSDFEKSNTDPICATAEVFVAGVARYVRVKDLKAKRSDDSTAQWVEIAELDISGTAAGSASQMHYGAKASASSCADGVTPDYGNDGNPSTYWKPSAEDPAPYWQMDAGAVYFLSKVTLNWDNTDAHRYAIQCSIDGQTWKTLVDRLTVGAAAGSSTTTDPCSALARYVRIVLPAGSTEGFWVNIEGYRCTGELVPSMPKQQASSATGFADANWSELQWTVGSDTYPSAAAGVTNALTLELPEGVTVAVDEPIAAKSLTVTVVDGNGDGQVTEPATLLLRGDDDLAGIAETLTVTAPAVLQVPCTGTAQQIETMNLSKVRGSGVLEIAKGTEGATCSALGLSTEAGKTFEGTLRIAEGVTRSGDWAIPCDVELNGTVSGTLTVPTGKRFGGSGTVTGQLDLANGYILKCGASADKVPLIEGGLLIHSGTAISGGRLWRDTAEEDYILRLSREAIDNERAHIADSSGYVVDKFTEDAVSGLRLAEAFELDLSDLRGSDKTSGTYAWNDADKWIPPAGKSDYDYPGDENNTDAVVRIMVPASRHVTVVIPSDITVRAIQVIGMTGEAEGWTPGTLRWVEGDMPSGSEDVPSPTELTSTLTAREIRMAGPMEITQECNVSVQYEDYWSEGAHIGSGAAHCSVWIKAGEFNTNLLLVANTDLRVGGGSLKASVSCASLNLQTQSGGTGLLEIDQNGDFTPSYIHGISKQDSLELAGGTFTVPAGGMELSDQIEVSADSTLHFAGTDPTEARLSFAADAPRAGFSGSGTLTLTGKGRLDASNATEGSAYNGHLQFPVGNQVVCNIGQRRPAIGGAPYRIEVVRKTEEADEVRIPLHGVDTFVKPPLSDADDTAGVAVSGWVGTVAKIDETATPAKLVLTPLGYPKLEGEGGTVTVPGISGEAAMVLRELANSGNSNFTVRQTTVTGTPVKFDAEKVNAALLLFTNVAKKNETDGSVTVAYAFGISGITVEGDDIIVTAKVLGPEGAATAAYDTDTLVMLQQNNLNVNSERTFSADRSQVDLRLKGAFKELAADSSARFTVKAVPSHANGGEGDFDATAPDLPWGEWP